LRIALVAPFEEPVPPRTYGGTELVVYNLAEELVTLGHEVVVYASGDSRVTARLESIFPLSLRTDPSITDPALRDAMKTVGLGRLILRLNEEEFDVIHNHFGWRLLSLAGHLNAPVVTTFHGPLHLEYYKRVFSELPPYPFISISDAQRRPQPDLNYVATVYNGIDCASFEWCDQPGEYLAFLGRFSPEKGPLDAIHAARAAGVPLVMAGKVDFVDREYFEQQVQPHIDGSHVRFIGEVNHAQKNELLKNARALLVPIAWEEPFGLVMVESLASGTPVIAHRRGSVPEIIAEDVGFITENVFDMTQAIHRLDTLSRARCRQYVCEKFGRTRMAQCYAAAYEKVLEREDARFTHRAQALG